MAPLRRVVLDVLKPHEPVLLAFTDRLAETETVDGVTTSLIERDQEVQNVQITLEGEDLAYEAVEDTIEDLGGTVHSVDQVSMGTTIVTDGETPQDG